MKSIYKIALGMFVFFTVSFIGVESLGIMDDFYVHERLVQVNGLGTGILDAAIASLLTIDLFLPVPSNILMLMSGVFSGFFRGSLVNMAGALGGAFIGFGLCRKYGKNAFERINGKQDVERVHRVFETYGVWIILLSRSVPMLTEIISCLSGLSAMSFKKFVFFSTLGTLPVCMVYAYMGSMGFDNNTQIAYSALIALVLPAAGYGILKLTVLRNKV